MYYNWKEGREIASRTNGLPSSHSLIRHAPDRISVWRNLSSFLFLCWVTLIFLGNSPLKYGTYKKTLLFLCGGYAPLKSGAGEIARWGNIICIQIFLCVCSKSYCHIFVVLVQDDELAGKGSIARRVDRQDSKGRTKEILSVSLYTAWVNSVLVLMRNDHPLERSLLLPWRWGLGKNAAHTKEEKIEIRVP